MAYQTLYRAFRPTKFSDVSGQPQVTDVLERQIEKGTPAHAYLFCGTRGTGKTTTARILANALNCESPVNGSPCGECAACRAFAQDGFVDVLEIDAASNNGVDNIRDIREKAALLPVAGKYKVYIIDEVHMLSPGAFNALLKTLEEPPEHTVFILATTEFRKIPKTIVSRCQRYDFHRISGEDIVKRLQFVAESLGLSAEPEALEMLASQSEGALRDALSLMDQCIAGSDRLTAQDVRATLGISDNEVLSQMCDAMMNEDAGGVLECAQQLTDGGTSAAHVLGDTVSELSRRLAKSGSNVEEARALLRSLEVLIGAQGSLRYSPAPGAVLTAALVRAALSATDTDAANLEVRVRKLEDKLERLGAGTPVAARAGAAAAVSEPAPAPATRRAAPVRGLSASKETAEEEQPLAPAESSGQDQLLQFQQVIAEVCGPLGPPAKTIRLLEIRPDQVTGFVEKKDRDFADLLVSDAFQDDLKAALASVFGEPAPRFRLKISETSVKKKEVQQNDGHDEILKDLADWAGGTDKVEILRSDNT